MIGFLASVITLAVVFGLVYWLVSMLPLAEPFLTLVRVCAILIAILLVLGIATGHVGLPISNFSL